jgi:hypothetical protein
VKKQFKLKLGIKAKWVKAVLNMAGIKSED